MWVTLKCEREFMGVFVPMKGAGLWRWPVTNKPSKFTFSEQWSSQFIRIHQKRRLCASLKWIRSRSSKCLAPILGVSLRDCHWKKRIWTSCDHQPSVKQRIQKFRLLQCGHIYRTNSSGESYPSPGGLKGENMSQTHRGMPKEPATDN